LINQQGYNAIKPENSRAFILQKNIQKKSGELSSMMKSKKEH